MARDARRLQRTLNEQQRQAEVLMQQLSGTIQTNCFDSLWLYSHVDENIVFYIYQYDKMVYWSNSWLTSTARVTRPIYDQWYFAQWDNAQGVCYRTKINEFQIVVAIPIKYNYSVTSSQLHNSFIPPFHADEQWTLNFIRLILVFLFTLTTIVIYSLLVNSKRSLPLTHWLGLVM